MKIVSYICHVINSNIMKKILLWWESQSNEDNILGKHILLDKYFPEESTISVSDEQIAEMYWNELNFITPDFLKEIGYRLEKWEGGCGVAKEIRARDMTVLSWNVDGAHCNYFGDPITEPNIFFGIKKDGGTRTAFNGYVFNQEQIVLLLKLTA